MALNGFSGLQLSAVEFTHEHNYGGRPQLTDENYKRRCKFFCVTQVRI